MTDQEKLAIYENSIDTLKQMTEIQCSNGNWNYDPYMHGMANGMIFALSIFTDKKPKYLEAPEKWLKDIKISDTIESEQV